MAPITSSRWAVYLIAAKNRAEFFSALPHPWQVCGLVEWLQIYMMVSFYPIVWFSPYRNQTSVRMLRGIFIDYVRAWHISPDVPNRLAPLQRISCWLHHRKFPCPNRNSEWYFRHEIYWIFDIPCSIVWLYRSLQFHAVNSVLYPSTYYVLCYWPKVFPNSISLMHLYWPHKSPGWF